MEKNLKMKNFFFKKRVLITGHTGFKGSWLSLWMHYMGANVMGVSNGDVSRPSNFRILKIKNKIKSKKFDIKNFKKTKRAIESFKPNFIFHLAAEAIVKRSYKYPKKTWETNLLGTINILEILKNYNKKVTVVIITSDKVYKNFEISRGYKEEDALGNIDPYSASKASADLATQSYIKSFLTKNKNIKIAIARAGNVIGGGDWAEGRLIPDCIKSWSKNKIVTLRNPKSTRPWQHVLDVLNGYITLAIKLNKTNKINGEVFNFGPKIERNNEVINVVKKMQLFWNQARWKLKLKNKFYESNLLHLDSSKANKLLNWKCNLDLNKTIFFTISWYKHFHKNPSDIYNYSIQQLNQYLKIKNK